MIEICLQDKTPYVYKIEDWKKLRIQYRIIGELLGNNFRTLSLPLKLLPEEALLLVDKGLAKLVSYSKLKCEPTKADEDAYVDLQDKLLDEQKELYKELRRKQIEDVIDKIIEGKRKKGDQRSRRIISEEELNKCSISKDNMLWPILMKHTDTINGSPCDTLDDELVSQTSEIRFKVFTDLWKKGYYVTAADKFGGDFLTYLDDPLNCHAVNIIRCVDNPQEAFHSTEIVAFGRLGHSVKKNPVFATVTNNHISYITLNWNNS